MSELLEEQYTYDDILTLIKSINGLVQSERCWFNKYIKTMTLKTVFKNSRLVLVYYTY